MQCQQNGYFLETKAYGTSTTDALPEKEFIVQAKRVILFEETKKLTVQSKHIFSLKRVYSTSETDIFLEKEFTVQRKSMIFTVLQTGVLQAFAAPGRRGAPRVGARCSRQRCSRQPCSRQPCSRARCSRQHCAPDPRPRWSMFPVHRPGPVLPGAPCSEKRCSVYCGTPPGSGRLRYVLVPVLRQ